MAVVVVAGAAVTVAGVDVKPVNGCGVPKLNVVDGLFVPKENDVVAAAGVPKVKEVVVLLPNILPSVRREATC